MPREEPPARHKFINSPETCVQDSLHGFVAVNPGVRLLRQCGAAVRHDFEQLGDKVALVAGGGSGHEPGFTGFIGEGLLTAAVAGPIYTSPFSDNILAALRTVGAKNKCGILTFVCNYTGDRLTFGIAIEKARAEGIAVGMVLIAEDTALSHTFPSTGRRGLCGAVFMMKIAGAMADMMHSLEEIKTFINEKKELMGTITVALTPCSLPGKEDLLFNLPHDKMELGMGVHGEAGTARIPVLSASETAQLLIEHLRSASSKSSLPLKKGDHVAVMFNNLGSLTTLEMNILAKEIIGYLEAMGISVVRAYSGFYMTSLESAGISVSVLKVDATVLKYLDAPTNAPAWTKPYCPAGHDRFTPADIPAVVRKSTKAEEEFLRATSQVCTLTPEEQEKFRHAIIRACDSLLLHEKELNKLDSESGDGDCGTTLATGAQGVLAYLETRPSLAHPGVVMVQLSHVASSSMGGTSGAIYSLLFLGAAKAFEILSGYNAWVAALELGMQLVMKYSMAHVGDRTMLDTLDAALRALQSNQGASSHEEVQKNLHDALKAMSAAVALTLNMKPRAGRATYVNQDLLKHVDPGARAVEIWLGWVIRSLLKSSPESSSPRLVQPPSP
ncbi:unnamed protein product [Ixodes hexagonus]